MKFAADEPKGERARYLIENVILNAERPLSAAEIADRMKRVFKVYISVAGVSANLAYLRVAGKVMKIRVREGFRRARGSVFANMVTYWHRPEKKNEAWIFKRQRTIQLEQQYQNTLPLHKRRRKAARTDDMRQMVEDIRHAQG